MLLSIIVAACGGGGGGGGGVGAGSGGGGISGVTLSAPLGGITSIDGTQGVTLAPTGTVTNISWGSANGAFVIMYYESTQSLVGVTFASAVSGGVSNGVTCAVVTAVTSYPLCSSKGVVFDKGIGKITFTSTPLNISGNTPSGITATGSLSFIPF